MRTARENYRYVMAKAMAEVDDSAWDRYLEHTDAALAALRAEGLVIVAAADLREAIDCVRADVAMFASSDYDSIQGYVPELRAVADRLDAALAAGGTDGQS